MSNFNEIISNIRSKHVYIQTHNFPDPDAIASAFGLSKLLKHYNIDSSICYKGKIDRYSTNDMIKRLGIELTNLDDIENMNTTDEIILVDTQKGNNNIFDAVGDQIICIDHHPSFDNSNRGIYRYADIRPEIGACATIIAGYYIENGIEMDGNIATALLYGIKSDTKGLSRGVSKKDVEVYEYLFARSNREVLGALEHCSINLEDLKAYANAINSIEVYDKVSFANTGENCPEALIASVCDFMIDLVEVEFSVVYSIKEDGIKLSVRSGGVYDAGKITNQALIGLGGGGGHASMAGGFVPFTDKNNNAEEIIGRIQARFLDVIGKDTLK